MKKLILLVFCFVLAAFTLVGCSHDSDPFTRKEYTADAAQIEEIRIDVRDREIEAAVSEDGQLRIVYYENSKEGYDIAVSAQKVLTMTGTSSKGWKDYFGVKPAAENRKILVQLPEEALENLLISTTNGDIRIPALAVTGSIRLFSNGGDIGFEKLTVGDGLYLTAKNGNISGTVGGGYEDFAIQAETKKGESNLPGNKESGEKTLHVSCNNGDVFVEFVKD